MDNNLLGFFAMMAVIVIAAAVVEIMTKGRRKGQPSEPPPAFTSLSLLAGLSFFSGLGAILLVSVAGILNLSMSMSEVMSLSESTRRQVDLAARILLYVSLLPAVGAAAFGLAGRGMISESRGTVRGRPLYRTGILLALVTGGLVFNAKFLDPATSTAEATERASARVEQGYLGVEPGNIDHETCVPLVRVIPGSPAEKAGLKAGDRVETVDGTRVYQIPPHGSAAQGWYSQGTNYLGGYIGSLKPGAQVTFGVRRGKERLTIVAELAASFDSLLELLKSQSLDDERAAVLKAAGADRRHTAGELSQICKAFDGDESRLKVIQTALPKLLDPQNAYQILGSLELPDSKTKVSSWIEALRKQE